jgi:hypothetical protein
MLDRLQKIASDLCQAETDEAKLRRVIAMLCDMQQPTALVEEKDEKRPQPGRTRRPNEVRTYGKLKRVVGDGPITIAKAVQKARELGIPLASDSTKAENALRKQFNKSKRVYREWGPDIWGLLNYPGPVELPAIG